MARKYRGVVGKGKKPCTNGLAKLFEVATREVGATDAAAEQRVTSEDPALDGCVEANASSGMAWGANHLQNTFANFDFLIIPQILVRKVDVAHGLHSKPYRLTLGLPKISMRVGMCRHRDAVAMLHGFVPHHMIHMSMGVDHHQRLQLMTVDEAKQTVFFRRGRTSGINDDTFTSFFITDDIGVFTEWVENKRVQFEHNDRF